MARLCRKCKSPLGETDNSGKYFCPKHGAITKKQTMEGLNENNNPLREIIQSRAF